MERDRGAEEGRVERCMSVVPEESVSGAMRCDVDVRRQLPRVRRLDAAAGRAESIADRIRTPSAGAKPAPVREMRRWFDSTDSTPILRAVGEARSDAGPWMNAVSAAARGGRNRTFRD